MQFGRLNAHTAYFLIYSTLKLDICSKNVMFAS